MTGGSIVPVPKDWPNFGESNSDYRKRIWGKHQSRISEKVASGGSGQLLDFTKWERTYSAEVDKYYEQNKDRKKPPAPAEKDNKAPKELKQGCGFLLLLVIVLIGGLSWYGSTLPSTTTEKLTLMPNVMGKTFEEVNQLFETNCAEIECGYSDLVGNRSILIRTNWIIADQSPRPGADLTKTEKICFGVRKTDETEDQHEYVISECSTSELAFRKEQATAWTQGYKDFGNGFAGDIEKQEPCTFEGRKGFCAYGTVVSRDGTTAGSVIKVQWGRRSDPTIEGSPFLVSEVSVFSTSGGVSPGSKFTFTAFIPNNKSWYWTLDAVLYEVS